MAQEQWTPWKSLTDISRGVQLEVLSDANKEFTLCLRIVNEQGKWQKLQLLFGDSVLFYQKSDEATKLLIMGSLEKICPFFRVINSKLIETLSKESDNPASLHNAMHFSIFEPNFIIDIVATNEPQIIWIQYAD